MHTFTHTHTHTPTHTQVVLCTMRNSCNRDMLERSAHVYDFDPVFLDDALDRLIVPRGDAEAVLELPVYCTAAQ